MFTGIIYIISSSTVSYTHNYMYIYMYVYVCLPCSKETCPANKPVSKLV